MDAQDNRGASRGGASRGARHGHVKVIRRQSQDGLPLLERHPL